MKTVKVRVAVAVDTDGKWAASGWGTLVSLNKEQAMDIAVEGVEPGEARYWLEAELTIPEHTTIQATVEEIQ